MKEKTRNCQKEGAKQDNHPDTLQKIWPMLGWQKSHLAHGCIVSNELHAAIMPPLTEPCYGGFMAQSCSHVNRKGSGGINRHIGGVSWGKDSLVLVGGNTIYTMVMCGSHTALFALTEQWSLPQSKIGDFVPRKWRHYLKLGHIKGHSNHDLIYVLFYKCYIRQLLFL